MEIFKNPNVNWIGRKWQFASVSLLLTAAGVASLIVKGGLGLSVDFTGGTLVLVNFAEEPDLPQLRTLLSGPEFRAEQVSRFTDQLDKRNQVQIRMPGAQSESQSQVGDIDRRLHDALRKAFDPDSLESDKRDFNDISRRELANWLDTTFGEEGLGEAQDGQSGGERRWARTITDFREDQGGLITDFSQLSRIELPKPISDALRDQFYLSSFKVVSVESVGPQVGDEMQERARYAVGFSLLGMLVYITLRFQLIYGLAAIVALFHDVFITVGAFSLTDQEISLTVIAALLTLVGYSLNDTIVVFDRVRENMLRMRRQNMISIINLSINQTLNRTVLTSTTFFMAALALYIFGGEALSGFSFALVIGVLVGTFSSVAIASPIVVWWEQRRQRRKA